jgi:hypothetical protein
MKYYYSKDTFKDGKPREFKTMYMVEKIIDEVY